MNYLIKALSMDYLVKISAIVFSLTIILRLTTQTIAVIDQVALMVFFALYLVTVITYFIDNNLNKILKIRIILDNIAVMYISVRVFGEYSLLYGFLFQIVFGLFCNYIYLNNDKRMYLYLGISPLIQLLMVFSFNIKSYPLKAMIIYIITAIMISICILILTKQLPTIKSKNNDAEKFMSELIKHEIRNSMTAVNYYLKFLEPSQSALIKVKDVLNRIQNVIDDQVVSDLHALIWKIVASLKHKFQSVEISIDENTKVSPNIKMSILLLSLYVFIENAFEASSTSVKIYLNNNNLVIQDNGLGFDTSKITFGYSTKNKSHGAGGRGLITTLDMLESQNIKVDISSKIKHGTTVCLNISNFLPKGV